MAGIVLLGLETLISNRMKGPVEGDAHYANRGIASPSNFHS